MNTFFRLSVGERKKLIFSLAQADSGIGSGQNFASLSVAPVRGHITLSLSGLITKPANKTNPLKSGDRSEEINSMRHEN